MAINKKTIIGVAVFVVLEVVAVIVAVMPFYGDKAPRASLPQLRLGIVSDVSKTKSSKDWEVFFRQFTDDLDFTVRPYFANSYEEALSGVAHGSLDLLYINPAVYLDLEKRYGVTAILYHKMPDADLEKNRAIIIARSDLKFLDDTKGLRMCFMDKNSLSGYILPRKFLEEKLKTSADKWFSDVAFAGTSLDALDRLTRGKTDVAALGFWMLDENLAQFPELSGKISTLWVSALLPEPVICLSPNSPHAAGNLPEKLKTHLWNRSKKKIFSGIPYNRLSFSFAPVDALYVEKLKKLVKLLDQYALPDVKKTIEEEEVKTKDVR